MLLLKPLQLRLDILALLDLFQSELQNKNSESVMFFGSFYARKIPPRRSGASILIPNFNIFVLSSFLIKLLLGDILRLDTWGLHG